MNKILEINKVAFAYGDVPVLQSVDLSLTAGQFVAVSGDNGAGKSTLMKLLLGDLRPSQGQIRLFGDLSSVDGHYRDLAYLSQNAVSGYRNFPTTVAELIRVYLAQLKRKSEPTALLDTVGLGGVRTHRLRELSGGQLQRVGVLLALLKQARLILLDEPTGGIDQKFSLDLYHLLREQCDQGKTVLMVTHQLAEVAPFLDDALRLSAGRFTPVELEAIGVSQ
ncbi:ATP-binding cassette domain-containing protein [Varibaculum cambriense]|uniref:metal ABC transporter ATP-binding protein n=1 Tax=Varibaculum cambriense TaxID=184870 RepID=UPI002913A37A|nr:ATP-binding cassette domain-containing protein [Varibaculum cambriense]MDU5541646.1 ATP-binding cassette domain-containing protein [Varibaculum cambriense]